MIMCTCSYIFVVSLHCCMYYKSVLLPMDAVTLRGSNNETFQGFLVVARNDALQRVGSFTSGDGDSKPTCSVSMHKCLRQSQKY